MVSCHSDYVMTALRPDWVFECDRHRFLTFPPRAATEHGVAEPTVPNLIQAKPLDDVLAYVQKHLGAAYKVNSLRLHGTYSGGTKLHYSLVLGFPCS